MIMSGTALEFVWYMIQKASVFVFSAQILPGVTLGSLFVALFVFGVLLNTLLRVPDKYKGSIGYRNHVRDSYKGSK